MFFRIFIFRIASILYFVSIVSFASFRLCSSSFGVDLLIAILIVLFRYRSCSINLIVIMRCLFEVYHSIEQANYSISIISQLSDEHFLDFSIPFIYTVII